MQKIWFFHRETFLSSGNVSAYQNVTDRMSHALPPLSNSAIQSAFASQLRLPQFLDPQSCRVSKAYLQRQSSSVCIEFLGEQSPLQFLLGCLLFPTMVQRT